MQKKLILLTYAVVFCTFASPQVGAQNSGSSQNEGLPVVASVTADGPAVVKAGETTAFSVTLDQPPNFDGGRIYAEFQANGKPVFSTAQGVNQCDRTYSFSILIPIDSAAATWVLGRLVFAAGTHIERPIPIGKTISFQIIPASDLRFPTSAEVTINLSQAQLLRTEASKLERQVQELKAMLSSPRNSENSLEDAIREALTELDSTETAFRKMATAKLDSDVTGIFFDDLRRTYRDAASTLSQREKAASSIQTYGRVLRVSQRTDYPPAA